jgi:hypothetical protein
MHRYKYATVEIMYSHGHHIVPSKITAVKEVSWYPAGGKNISSMKVEVTYLYTIP